MDRRMQMPGDPPAAVAGLNCQHVQHSDPNGSPDQLRALESRIQDRCMHDFSIQMTNQLQFSSCDAPWLPTTSPQQEALAVELHDGLLTMTELRVDGSLGNRIYAQHTVDLAGAMTFVILPQLPSRIRDGSFFPALGTAVVFEGQRGKRRRLRAVGTDINSQRCRGWIFDAWET